MLYKFGSWKCNLCLSEKVIIVRFEELSLLNKQIKYVDTKTKSSSKHKMNKKDPTVAELILASLFQYQLNCVIVRESAERYPPVKVYFS